MKERLSAFCLFLFVLFVGIGQIALLPLFEGQDETGHYSGIRQIAGLGSVPLLGSGFLDRAVIAYRAQGPLPYASAVPFDNNKGMTYPAFFARRDLVDRYLSVYRVASANEPFATSDEPNWETQHPPLYYLLLGAVAKASSSFSFTGQFFVLRLASYLMAVGGLLMGMIGTLRFMKERYETTPIFVPEQPNHPDKNPPFLTNRSQRFLFALFPRLGRLYESFPSQARKIASFPGNAAGSVLSLCSPRARWRVTFAFLLYPLIVPQFFPEFARLGNDSLCLLLMGLAWPLMLRWATADTRDPRPAFALGVALALGLLTKGLFWAVTAGIGAFVLYRLWLTRNDRALRTEQADNALVLFLPVLLACFWYLYKWKAMGSFLGHPDYAALDREGDFGALFFQKASLQELAFGFLSVPFTFSWAGTASLARPYAFAQMPVLLFALWIAARYARTLRGVKITELRWLPVWLTVPFLLGLAYHVLALIALKGQGNTPGWYLNVLAPALAYAFALALKPIGRYRFLRRLFLALSAYNAVFLAWTLWAQFPLFAGFAKEGAHKIYSFSAFPFDLPHGTEIIERLSVLAWPQAALALFGTGIVCLLVGLGLLAFVWAAQETQSP